MKPINILILFSFYCSQVNSNADFTGTYEFSKWDKTIVGGSITSASNDSVTLISSNDDNEDAPQLYTNQDLTISILTDGNVSFHWQYNSDDESSFWDPFWLPVERYVH